MTQLQIAGFSKISAVKLYGIYTGKCYVLTHFPVSVNMALATSLVPAIASALAVKNYKEASDKITASMRLTVLIGLPSSMGLYILAQPILKLLFPASSEGASLLALSSFTIIFIGMTQTLAGVLQGMGKAYVPAVALIVGAFAKLVINQTLIKIPSINIKGAVYGTLACYIIALAICFASVLKNFKLNFNFSNLIIKPIAATAVMGFATHYSYAWIYRVSSSNFAAVMTSILISVLVFGLVLLVTGAVSRQDISALPFGKNASNTLSRKGLLR